MVQDRRQRDDDSRDGYRLVDLGSLNGTTVNATPVKEHLLVEGDIIGIGAVAVRFEAS